MIVCNFIKGQGLLKMPDGTYKGKTMHVEWHDYCGPMLMIKDWQRDCARQPKENSRYWQMMNQWRNGGFKVNEHGYLLDADGVEIN